MYSGGRKSQEQQVSLSYNPLYGPGRMTVSILFGNEVVLAGRGCKIVSHTGQNKMRTTGCKNDAQLW